MSDSPSSIAEQAQRFELADRMARFYQEVDGAVAAHKPTCQNRGACCKFASFGHRLYVTDLELAYFHHCQEDRLRAPTSDGACPYQVGGLCTARDHRPLGCRIFFCDESAKAWQGPEYERFLARLKQLGDELGVPYRYREWLSALVGLSAPPTEKPATSALSTGVDPLKLHVIQ